MALRFRRHSIFGAQYPKHVAAAAGLLGVVLFLVPLIALPPSADFWEAQKSFVLVLGVAAAFVLTAGISYGERRLPAIFNRSDWFWLIFFGVYLFSVLFSVHRATSVFGVRGVRAESLLTFGALLVFFYLFRALFRDVRLVFIALWTALASLTLGALLYLFGIFGFPILGDVSILPLLANSHVMVGTASALTFSVLVTVLFSGIWKDFRPLFSLGITIHGMLLFILDLNIAWYVLLLGVLVLILLLGIRRELRPALLTAAIGLGILAALFLFVDTRSLTNITAAPDVLLGQAASAEIAKEALAKNPVFGSGPGTFLYDYLRFAPSELYESGGAMQFVRSGSQWWQWFTTLGFGALLLFGLVLSSLVRLFRVIQPLKRQGDQLTALAVDLTFLTGIELFFVSLFFPLHLALLVLWFLVFGMAEVLLKLQGKRARDRTFRKRTARIHLTVTVGIALIATFGVLGSFRSWGAELAFGSALAKAQNLAPLEDITSRLRMAAALAPWDAVTRATLAEQLALDVALNGGDMDDVAREKRTAEIRRLLTSARQSNPLHPAIPSSLLRAHRFLGVSSPYPPDELEEAFRARITQEPNQAVHYLEYALYTIERAGLEDGDAAAALLVDAEQLLRLAKERNASLPSIDFARARVWSMQGRHEEAIATLTALVKFYPAVADFTEALAQEYEAIGESEKAVQLRIEGSAQ